MGRDVSVRVDRDCGMSLLKLPLSPLWQPDRHSREGGKPPARGVARRDDANLSL